MRIYVTDLNATRHEIQVEGSTTITELYHLVWLKCGVKSDHVTAASSSLDGLGIGWCGKRLHVGIDARERNVAGYNIQGGSMLHVIFYETNARQRYQYATMRDCSVCLETLSNMGFVGYRQCENNHFFHFHCTRQLETCPLCRTRKWAI